MHIWFAIVTFIRKELSSAAILLNKLRLFDRVGGCLLFSGYCKKYCFGLKCIHAEENFIIESFTLYYILNGFRTLKTGESEKKNEHLISQDMYDFNIHFLEV